MSFFPELPRTLASNESGCFLEYLSRLNANITWRDIRALMPRFREGTDRAIRLGTLSRSSSVFRQRNALPGWRVRYGSETIRDYLDVLYGPGVAQANTLKGFRELARWELYGLELIGAGTSPEKARGQETDEVKQLKIADVKGREMGYEKLWHNFTRHRENVGLEEHDDDLCRYLKGLRNRPKEIYGGMKRRRIQLQQQDDEVDGDSPSTSRKRQRSTRTGSSHEVEDDSPVTTRRIHRSARTAVNHEPENDSPSTSRRIRSTRTAPKKVSRDEVRRALIGEVAQPQPTTRARARLPASSTLLSSSSTALPASAAALPPATTRYSNGFEAPPLVTPPFTQGHAFNSMDSRLYPANGDQLGLGSQSITSNASYLQLQPSQVLHSQNVFDEALHGPPEFPPFPPFPTFPTFPMYPTYQMPPQAYGPYPPGYHPNPYMHQNFTGAIFDPNPNQRYAPPSLGYGPQALNFANTEPLMGLPPLPSLPSLPPQPQQPANSSLDTGDLNDSFSLHGEALSEIEDLSDVYTTGVRRDESPDFDRFVDFDGI